MATKFGSGYVSKYLVDESFGSAFALRDVWTARADNIPVAHCPHSPASRPQGLQQPNNFRYPKNTPEFIDEFTHISVSCGDLHQISTHKLS
uniref:Uncharacterized protein n=1 Tax=Candidatus Kentrum sp. UNK TaxID=2126344 RepID=A0A451A3H0_9GAMM|nr:MAG: hypothetical protein BECKUNK1418G_GA0071005_10123 [Candidatus Kentron sp. UNK]VFK69889.1 MAG: hypothetical protein BECKUNK1418H_GA0071006_102038 [Candidatus Kentron sp. UNK]